VAFYKKNFFIDAQKYFEKALEIEPGYEVARKNLESAKKKDTIFKETITKLSEKVINEEKNPLIHYDLASAYRNTGHLQEAIVEYKKVLEIQPDNRDAIINF